MILQTPQQSNFNLSLAQELLLLVEEAHVEFTRSQEHPSWDWDNDTSSITVAGKTYAIRRRFGFAERLHTLHNSPFADIQGMLDLLHDRVPFGFIAHDTDSNTLYVVFRGTATPAEWIINFQFKPGDDPFLNNKDFGRVHRGFYTIYTRLDRGDNPFRPKDDLPSMKDTIENTILGCPSLAINDNWPAEALQECPADAQVYVTGHSLGGALATLATAHIHSLNHFKQKPILYAFANPRAGDAQFFQQFVDLDCFRIANSEDIVPTLPLASIDMTSASATDITSESLRKTRLSRLSALLPELDYHHIGDPIYFTLHEGAIADNHIIPAYKKALGIASQA
ncbi:MAG: lipase family protein [Synechococcaceae cyanobacterium]|jgi:triacylglycerol lipase